MAKQSSAVKLEKIREAAMEVIGEQGISNGSVAAIAQRAGVSVGYLYRHYAGKEELLLDLVRSAMRTITDRIDLLLTQTEDIREIIRGVVEFVLQRAEQGRANYKFMIMMMCDFSIEVHPSIRDRIHRIGLSLVGLGKKNHTLRDDISVEDLYLALVGIPMQYLTVQYKFDFQDRTKDQQALIDRIVAVSLKAIQ